MIFIKKKSLTSLLTSSCTDLSPSPAISDKALFCCETFRDRLLNGNDLCLSNLLYNKLLEFSSLYKFGLGVFVCCLLDKIEEARPPAQGHIHLSQLLSLAITNI